MLALSLTVAFPVVTLQAYRVALKQELDLVGIDVVGVYPGAIRTQLALDETMAGAIR